MYTLHNSLALLLALAVVCVSAVLDPFEIAQNPCAELRKADMICIDCSYIGYCVQEHDAWLTKKFAECSTGYNYYCNATTVRCEKQSVCELPSRGIEFECQMAGTFPDPYDCRYYHQCNSWHEDTRMVCGFHEHYSAKYGMCIGPLFENADCNYPQYNCTYAGESGAWRGDPRIYYVCAVTINANKESVIHPLLYKCPDGHIFNGSNCVESNYVTPVWPSLPGMQITTPYPWDSAVCQTSRWAPDGDDCHGYIACSNGEFFKLQCPEGTYFSYENSSCIVGSC